MTRFDVQELLPLGLAILAVLWLFLNGAFACLAVVALGAGVMSGFYIINCHAVEKWHKERLAEDKRRKGE